MTSLCTSPSPLLNLPSEILAHVYHYCESQKKINVWPRICKATQTITYLYTDKLSFINLKNQPYDLDSIKKFKKLRKITFCSNRPQDWKTLNSFIPSFRSLESIKIRESNPNTYLILEPCLKKLKLIKVSEEIVKGCIQKLHPSLYQLKVEGEGAFPLLSAHEFDLLASQLKNIRKCTLLDSERVITHAALSSLSKRNTLQKSCLHIPSGENGLSFLHSQPQLQTLQLIVNAPKIHFFNNIEPQALKPLNHLSIGTAVSLKLNPNFSCSPKNHRVLHLESTDFQFKNLIAILQRNDIHLNTITLLFNDISIQKEEGKIFESLGLMQKLAHLKSFQFTGNKASLTGDFLKLFLQKATEIEHLQVDIRNLSVEHFNFLIKLPLKTLSLSFDENVSTRLKKAIEAFIHDKPPTLNFKININGETFFPPSED